MPSHKFSFTCVPSFYSKKTREGGPSLPLGRHRRHRQTVGHHRRLLPSPRCAAARAGRWHIGQPAGKVAARPSSSPRRWARAGRSLGHYGEARRRGPSPAAAGGVVSGSGGALAGSGGCTERISVSVRMEAGAGRQRRRLQRAAATAAPERGGAASAWRWWLVDATCLWRPPAWRGLRR
jgi:hypothetical protein